MGNRKGSKRQKRYGFSTKGNKYGRPTRTVLPLSNRINIRLTEMQRDHLEYWSWRMDMTMGDYIRMLIDQDRAIQGPTRRRIKESSLSNRWKRKITELPDDMDREPDIGPEWTGEQESDAAGSSEQEDNKQENTDDTEENGKIS